MNTDNGEQTDPMAEITAMTEVAKALQPLDGSAVARVLQWAFARFAAETPAPTPLQPESGTESESDADVAQTTQASFETIADLYTAAKPKNDPEKALVAAYWFQAIGEQSDFDAAALNRELKHLGHGVSNITNALSSLMGRKPQLVIQTRKSGSSQQARKKYKLTLEGINYTLRLVRGED